MSSRAKTVSNPSLTTGQLCAPWSQSPLLSNGIIVVRIKRISAFKVLRTDWHTVSDTLVITECPEPTPCHKGTHDPDLANWNGSSQLATVIGPGIDTPSQSVLPLGFYIGNE
jgi:hypothetical protein